MTHAHVIITGASRGIGLSLARHFLEASWLVSGIDRDLQGVHDERYAHYIADIVDEAALDRAFDAAESRGAISAVVANAAVTDPEHRPIASLDYATWQRIQRINVDGTFLTLRAAARRIRNGGNIVIVTSSLAFLDQAKANDAPYCVSKSALEMLTRVAALELRGAGINVNSLYPSVRVDTGFFAHLKSAQRSELASPDLLNASALFLATRAPGTVTGISLDQQRWNVDDGYRKSLGGHA